MQIKNILKEIISLCCFQSNTEILLKLMCVERRFMQALTCRSHLLNIQYYTKIPLHFYPFYIMVMPGNTNNLKIPRMSLCCLRDYLLPV